MSKIVEVLAINRLEEKYGIKISSMSRKEFYSVSKRQDNGYCVNRQNKITHLRIVNESISHLNIINTFLELEVLDLSGNRISSLHELKNLKLLKELNLSDNIISQIIGINNLSLLQELNLSGNNISEIKGLEKSERLKKLNLSWNNIDEIKELENLKQLQKIDLSGNNITEIKGFECLTHLQAIDLSCNAITEIEGLTNCLYLIDLNLSLNDISEIKAIDNLVNLLHLNLAENKINEIKGLKNPTQLYSLDLSSNEIAEINGLESLEQLRILDLSENTITEIKGLEKLQHLTELNLSSNKISEIEGLGPAKKLANLNLCGNNIDEIKGLEKFEHLDTLLLNTNNIRQLSPVGCLKKLKKLELYENKIVSLAELEFIEQLDQLEFLQIHDNPVFLQTPALLLNKNSNQLNDIKNYLSSQQIRQYPITLPVKVMLLGNHSTGKTSFMHYFTTCSLAGTNITSTHVLDIHPYFSNDKKMPDAILYDFGGQDYYHGLYQAFFSRNAVNLLFWCNPYDKNQIREEDVVHTRDFTKEYWLHQLNYAFRKTEGQGGHADSDPLLLVQTHADLEGERPVYITTGTKSAFYIVNEFYVSFSDACSARPLFKISLEYLKESLLQEIKWKRKEEKKPAYYKKFLEFILTYNKKEAVALDSLLVSYHRKKQDGEDEKDIRNYLESDLKQLALRGMVLYYPENRKIKDMVWLNPSATIRHIHSTILSSSMLKEKHGILGETDFDALCTSKGIKELLLEEKVIFYDKAARNYIIPSYLPLADMEKTDFNMMTFDFTRPDFILKFKCFIPFGLINQLICFYGRMPDRKKFWRDQLIFTYQKKYKIWIKLDFTHLEIAVSISSHKNGSARPCDLQEIQKNIFHDILDLYWGDEPETVAQDDGSRNTHDSDLQPVRKTALQNRRKQETLRVPADMYLSLDDTYFAHYKEMQEATGYMPYVVAYPLRPGSREIDETCRRFDSVFKYKNFIQNQYINHMKKIFISYSRKDVEYKDELKKHLMMLKLFDIADAWSCDEIVIGKWDEQIQKQLDESDLVIFMLSVNFFSSDYILKKEVQKTIDALKKNKSKKVLCVVVSTFTGLDRIKTLSDHAAITPLQEAILCLADYQFLPYMKEKKGPDRPLEEKIVPLQKYPHLDDALTQITEKVLEVLNIDL